LKICSFSVMVSLNRQDAKLSQGSQERKEKGFRLWASGA